MIAFGFVLQTIKLNVIQIVRSTYSEVEKIVVKQENANQLFPKQEILDPSKQKEFAYKKFTCD